MTAVRSYRKGLSSIATHDRQLELTFRHVQVFIVVWETGSVSEAAKKLDVSQPAISAALSSLERLLGYELFHRRGSVRNSPVTNAGIILYPYMEKAYSAMRSVVETAVEIRVNPDYLQPVRKAGT